jgi:hypothetical protein
MARLAEEAGPLAPQFAGIDRRITRPGWTIRPLIKTSRRDRGQAACEPLGDLVPFPQLAELVRPREQHSDELARS